MSQGMPEFVVGRTTELKRYQTLLTSTQSILNIYGPGGIGKTVVGQQMRLWAAENNHLCIFLDGIEENLTPERYLQLVAEQLVHDQSAETHFSPFTSALETHYTIQALLETAGGIDQLYTRMGTPKNSAQFAQLLEQYHITTQATAHILRHRVSLHRYQRTTPKNLLETFCDNLEAFAQTQKHPITFLIDTYEEIEGLDDWVCREFVPRLRNGTKTVILGRNALTRVNFEWGEWANQLKMLALAELSEQEARTYLNYYGLHDIQKQKEIYRFTGGYPLLLVLVRHLAMEVGGWDQIGSLDYQADRSEIAKQLLKRILREERVAEVQAFLEIGCVARWFTPPIVAVVLQVSMEEGQRIYQLLTHHSFVQRHPQGLKFHDRIRELLEERLRYMNPFKHQAIKKRLEDHLAQQVGIPVKNSQPQTRVTPKKSFGTLLRLYRRDTKDPKRGGFLTQERFSEVLGEHGVDINSETISRYENDKRVISIDRRSDLIAMIAILFQYGGIEMELEANQLLKAAGHTDLQPHERINVLGKTRF